MKLSSDELTKKFETITRLKISELSDWVNQEKDPRGEYVIMVAGAHIDVEQTAVTDPRVLALAHSLSKVLGSKQVSEIISDFFSISKKDAYQIALQYKQINQ